MSPSTKDGAVVPLAAGELTLEVGTAWRTDHAAQHEAFSALVASIEPTVEKPLDIVG